MSYNTRMDKVSKTMRLSNIAAILLLIIVNLFNTIYAGAQSTPRGRLLVDLVPDSDGYKITRLTAFPDSAPPRGSTGDHEFRILDENGGILASGKVYLPQLICQERPDENGKLFGRAERTTGTITIELPYFSSGRRLELTESGRLVLQQDLKDVRLPVKSLPSSKRSAAPPDFAGFLAEIEAAGPTHLMSSQTTSVTAAATAANVNINGRIKVKGVKDYSLVNAKICFYQLGNETRAALVESDAEGKFSAELPAGRYLVTARCYYSDPDYPGDKVSLYPNPLIIQNFNPDNQKTLRFNWKLYKLFRGKLTVKDGGGIPGKVYILERNPSGSTYQPWFVNQLDTDQQGNFAIRLPEQRFVMIALPNPQGPAGELLTIVNVPKKSGKLSKLVCPRFGEVSGEQFKKIWDSGSETSRLNLVFLAEAYTSRLENFTDSNGNGIWDGDLLLDKNGNGQLDQGEYYYDRNSNGKYDKPEPFEDGNGDRICNRYERAQFEADAALAAAAMLNFHPYDDYTDVINVYTWWTPSEHGVQRFTGDLPWQKMNTYFGVYCYGIRGWQPCDIKKSASTKARQLLPNADEIVPIVMVHDPFKALCGSALFDFGRIIISAEDSRAGSVLVHELGHSVGNLWDEYLYDDASGKPHREPAGANVTTVDNPAKVKWSEFIAGTPPVPTPIYYDGYGLFEGASFYTHGIYRPTSTSMMNNLSYPYFLVNSRQIESVLQQFR
jgi:hypothetical protein